MCKVNRVQLWGGLVFAGFLIKGLVWLAVAAVMCWSAVR